MSAIRPTWAPSEIDLDRPSVARVYDYFLGGSHNFEADRGFARKVIAVMPDAVTVARQNRAFLQRAMRYLCGAGIDQFVDLGSGIPTVGNVHEIAREHNPHTRVVYVDIDPVAYAHSRALLADDPATRVIRADLRYPDEVLGHPDLRELIDLDRPVAFLMVAVLHFLPDRDRPAQIVAGYAAPAAPASHVVISHARLEAVDAGRQDALDLYRRSSAELIPRTDREIARLFGDLTLIEPGVVVLNRWRPDPADTDPPTVPAVAGVGRKG